MRPSAAHAGRREAQLVPTWRCASEQVHQPTFNLRTSAQRLRKAGDGRFRCSARLPVGRAIIIPVWCGRGDSNPHRHCCPTDFRTSYGFRRPRPPGKGQGGGFVVWTIPSPCSGRWKAPPEVRCCPSSLYTFPSGPADRWPPLGAWLGIAKELGFPEFGQFCIRGFPRSTQVAPQVRCVYRFRHARVTRPLYRPAWRHGRSTV